MQWNIGNLSWFCWAWKLASCDSFIGHTNAWKNYQDWSVAVVFVFHKHQPCWGQFWKIKCLIYTCANANWRPFLLNTLPAASSLCVDQVKALTCQWLSWRYICSVNHYRVKQEVPGLAMWNYPNISDIPRISAVSYTAALLLLVDQNGI